MNTTTDLAARAIASGDAEARLAHALLFERVFERVARYFTRMVPGDPSTADDLVGQTLLLIEESLARGTYDPGYSFGAWVWLKARTVYAQWCRSRAPRRMVSLEDAAGAAPIVPDPTEAVARRIDLEEILRRIETELGSEALEVVLLTYQSDLSGREVALAMGRDRKTLARLLESVHRAIDRLLENSRE